MKNTWAWRHRCHAHVIRGQGMSKICTKCKTDKPLSDYYFDKSDNRYRSACKVCYNKHTTMRRHGLSEQQYEQVTKSSSVCEICGRQKRLNIDHDHTTGLVRGVLCNTCNTLVGNFERRASMIAYLNRKPRFDFKSIFVC